MPRVSVLRRISVESFESVGRRFVPYAHAPKACKPAYEEGGLVQIGDDVIELER